VYVPAQREPGPPGVPAQSAGILSAIRLRVWHDPARSFSTEVRGAVSRRLKVLAVLNVVGWLVAVPLLVLALLGPVIGFSDWPGALGDRAGAGDVRLGEAGVAGRADEGGRGGSGASEGRSGAGTAAEAARAALDRALREQALDALPTDGEAGRRDGSGVPAELPADGGPGGRRSGPDRVVDLGPAPPLRPDGPRGGGGDGGRPGGDLGTSGAPAPPGPDVPAPAPGGAEPAGGTETPAGPGGRTRSGTRPSGGSYAEVQVPDVPEEVDAGGVGPVPIAAAEPPAPATSGDGPGPVDSVVTPAAPAPVATPGPQTPDLPAPVETPPGPDAPTEEPAGPDAVRPPEDGALAPDGEAEPPGGGG